MSRFVQGFHSSEAAQNRTGPIYESIVGEFPELGTALFGVPGENGQPTVWPCTLMLFMEGDKMKFCLNPKSGPKVCFGVVGDALQPMESVEKALRDGDFEWKPRGRRHSP